MENEPTNTLTEHEKQRGYQLMTRIISGIGTQEDYSEFSKLEARDPEYFISAQLNLAMSRPEFVDSGSVVDNIHRNAMLKIKLSELRSKQNSNQMTFAQKIDLNLLNRTMRKISPPQTHKSTIIDENGNEVPDD